MRLARSLVSLALALCACSKEYAQPGEDEEGASQVSVREGC